MVTLLIVIVFQLLQMQQPIGQFNGNDSLLLIDFYNKFFLRGNEQFFSVLAFYDK